MNSLKHKSKHKNSFSKEIQDIRRNHKTKHWRLPPPPPMPISKGSGICSTGGWKSGLTHLAFAGMGGGQDLWCLQQSSYCLKVFCLAQAVPFLVFWLETAAFCWWWCFVCSCRCFQVAGFYNKSGIYEAKTQETHHHRPLLHLPRSASFSDVLNLKSKTNIMDYY